MPKEIKVRIKKDGTTIIETSGFKGNECMETTDKMLKDLDALGISIGTVKEDKKKAEFYEQSTGIGVRSGY